MAEPIRLQKYFSDCGVLSRRAAEAEILAGNVTVNGIPATIGDKITPGADDVRLRGEKIHPRGDKPHVYVMLNKPRGYVTTAKDEHGRKTVTELTRSIGTRIYPVGRLDMDSEGLLLLTDDGEFANLLTHPGHDIPKIYRVTVSPVPTSDMISALKAPMELDGYRLRPIGLRRISENELEIELHEGRNRQIRRMCEQVGLSVVRLRRISVGKLTLGSLPVGQWRHLNDDEVAYLTAGHQLKGNQ